MIFKKIGNMENVEVICHYFYLVGGGGIIFAQSERKGKQTNINCIK